MKIMTPGTQFRVHVIAWGQKIEIERDKETKQGRGRGEPDREAKPPFMRNACNRDRCCVLCLGGPDTAGGNGAFSWDKRKGNSGQVKEGLA